MATVNALTAERTLAIEASMITGASVNGSGQLIISQYGGTTINAGTVKGAKGDAGTSGAVAVDSLEQIPAGTPAGTPIFVRA